MIELFKSKPKPQAAHLIHAVKFDPAGQLDELRRVAAKATIGWGKPPELVIAQFDSGPVLIVRYRKERGDGEYTETVWEHVAAGDYLAYFEEYGNLDALDDAEIAEWYVRADQ